MNAASRRAESSPLHDSGRPGAGERSSSPVRSARSVAAARAAVAASLVFLAAAAAPAHAQPATLSVVPSKPAAGALVRLVLSTDTATTDSIVGITGSMAGEPLHFIRATPGIWRALGGVPVDDADTVAARVTIRRLSGATETASASIVVPPLPAPSVTSSPRLAVPERFTRPLDEATRERIARENRLARSVGRRAHDSPPLWTAAFLRPRPSRVTSRFGTGRAFNGAVASRHLGVDFSGAVGAPVKAANRGVVALVDTFFLAGRVVYIDHGGGVVTGYFHLSEPLVAVGDTVARGQTIGRVGASGRVTGPHLHWTARYGALTVDPLDLVELESGWYGGGDSGRRQLQRKKLSEGVAGSN